MQSKQAMVIAGVQFLLPMILRNKMRLKLIKNAHKKIYNNKKNQDQVTKFKKNNL